MIPHLPQNHTAPTDHACGTTATAHRFSVHFVDGEPQIKQSGGDTTDDDDDADLTKEANIANLSTKTP